MAADKTNDILVGGTLHSIATGNIIAHADEVLDEDWGANQAEINQELKNSISGNIEELELEITELKDTIDNYTVNGYTISSNPTLDNSDIGLGNVTNDAQVKRSEMGVADGVATLGDNGKVPASLLPSYVDDVLEGIYVSETEFTLAEGLEGEVLSAGVVYVDTTTNKTYRWSGTLYVIIGTDLALGETSETAYPGDKGKAVTDKVAEVYGANSVINGLSDVTFDTDDTTELTLSAVNAIETWDGSNETHDLIIPYATISKAGVMSAADKTKLEQSVFADEEDITAETGVLKFKDREYDSDNFSGKGYKILRKNILDEKNILTLDMINEENTIYEIRYDFDLNGETITIPEGCVLDFQGGSFSNGIVQCSNTTICANKKVFDCEVLGSIVGDVHLIWFTDNCVISDYSYDNTGCTFTESNIYTDNNFIYRAITLACINNTWLNGDNINIVITTAIEMTDDRFCSLKNINIYLRAEANDESAILYNGTQAYVLTSVNLENIKIYNAVTNYRVHGIYCKVLYNTTNWYFKNIEIIGLSGYAIINCGYLQEGLIENIRVRYVGGFISYNPNSIYGNSVGSSNILTIRNCSLDSGVHNSVDATYCPYIIDICGAGSILFEKIVLQGTNTAIPSIRTSPSTATYTNLVFEDLWLEFSDDVYNKIVFTGPTTCTIQSQHINAIDIQSDDVSLTLCKSYFFTTERTVDLITVNDDVSRCYIALDMAYQGTYQIDLSNLYSLIQRGFLHIINLRQLYLPSDNTIITSLPITFTYNTIDNFIARFLTYSNIYNYISYRPPYRICTVNDIDVLEIDASNSSEYPYSDFVLRNTSVSINDETNNDVGSSRCVYSSIIYRIKKTSDDFSISLTIGNGTIQGLDTDVSSDFGDWKRIMYVTSGTTEDCSINLTNGVIQIAKFYVGYNFANIDNDIIIIDGDIKRNPAYISQIYPTMFSKAQAIAHKEIFIDCTSAKFLIDGRIYKSDGTHLIDEITALDIACDIYSDSYSDEENYIAGNSFFNSSLNKPVWWNGTEWVTYPDEYDVATTTEDGLMSSEDKTKLDNIYTGLYDGNLELVTPVISGTWTFYNNSDEEIEASNIANNPTTTENPTLEYGYKARFTGTYSWTSEDGKKDPTSLGSSSSWTTLTASGVTSDSYDTGIVSSATTVQVILEAAKTGFMLSSDGSTIVPASGNDTTTASKRVSFSYRKYYGAMTGNDISETNIKALTSTLSTSKSLTASSVTCNTSLYYVYAYPQALGTLTTIIQDGAQPVLGAFTQSTLTITNDAGASVDLYVYISNNPGAFTNASLEFS